jgi:hypothetical protein
VHHLFTEPDEQRVTVDTRKGRRRQLNICFRDMVAGKRTSPKRKKTQHLKLPQNAINFYESSKPVQSEEETTYSAGSTANSTGDGCSKKTEKKVKIEKVFQQIKWQ